MNTKKIAWSSKVSADFIKKVCEIAAFLEIEPDWLMACMAFETGQTFNPAVKNSAGSGAVGLIQFMPSTALALGTTTEKLEKMDSLKQLEYVKKYFKNARRKLKSLEDCYMAIIWPAAVGKPSNTVLFYKKDAKRPKLYIQNAGLDFNKDGLITKAEAAAKVKRLLAVGMAHTTEIKNEQSTKF